MIVTYDDDDDDDSDDDDDDYDESYQQEREERLRRKKEEQALAKKKAAAEAKRKAEEEKASKAAAAEAEAEAKAQKKRKAEAKKYVDTLKNPPAGKPSIDGVKKVPKLSALLARGGPEAEQYKKYLAEEALATWMNNSDRWEIVEHTFEGVDVSETKAEEEGFGSLEEGIVTFQNHPERYVAMIYPNMHLQDGTTKKKFTFVLRQGTTGYRPEGIRSDGKGSFCILRHMYQRLQPLENDVLPKKFCDKYTDGFFYEGKKLHLKNKPILPGRGMGIGDDANMRLIGDYAEPNDVFQGAVVGDCWLLSAIACLADYDWAVRRLFRKSKNFPDCPVDQPYQYVVTLWDLKTWKEVDVVVDERLPVRSDGSGFLFGALPSKDGKLWVPYLEKAIAAHCGGFDNLQGMEYL